MDTIIALVIAACMTLFFLRGYLKSLRERDRKAREAQEKGKMFSEGPKAQHPHIDPHYCIGCATCTTVCPEGDVLAMIGAKAAIVNGYKCIGHGLCADACPVGAITMVMANPTMSANVPRISAEFETSVPNLFIVGELGGLALINNAVNQGRDCVDAITRRLQASPSRPQENIYDVLIVGAGPAGISASLRAIENKLTHIAIIRSSQIVGSLEQALQKREVRNASAIVLLTGPSRTADIEMTLTIGVHGPTELHVFIVDQI
jgi:thioredoxin reductase (NADPH)